MYTTCASILKPSCDVFTSAAKEFHNLAIKQFSIPGESGWPLGTLFPAPANRTETGIYVGSSSIGGRYLLM